MPITPNPEAMLAVTQVMVKTVESLHGIIEKEHKHPKAAMVLMMAFITGVIIQLKDKIETLESGLGEQLLDAVNKTTNSTGREIIEKLNENDPSLDKSSSGIAPDDLHGAINFFVKKLADDIKTHMEELPYRLRNDITVLHSLSAIAGEIFNQFGVKDLDMSIENFSKNVRIFATKGDEENAFKKTYN